MDELRYRVHNNLYSNKTGIDFRATLVHFLLNSSVNSSYNNAALSESVELAKTISHYYSCSSFSDKHCHLTKISQIISKFESSFKAALSSENMLYKTTLFPANEKHYSWATNAKAKKHQLKWYEI